MYTIDRQYSRVVNAFVDQLNFEFERLNFAYRVVAKEIVEITSKEEIVTIEEAIHTSPFNIKIHLNKALELYAKRPTGDYRNSIKESIADIPDRQTLHNTLFNNPSLMASFGYSNVSTRFTPS